MNDGKGNIVRLIRVSVCFFITLFSGWNVLAQPGSIDTSYYFVANTRPPDAYLALRTDPSANRGQRIAELPNGTRLDVLQRRSDDWWYVKVVATGQTGWALSRSRNISWIMCCVDPSPLTNSPAPITHAVSAEIPMRSEGGTYTVPVLINNALTLDFIIDSGAADVSIPADVVSTLLRTGTITKADFIGAQTYVLADGSTVPSYRFRIRSLDVGRQTLQNVVASLAPAKGSLLLGQSFLSRFKSWSIDNSKHVLSLGTSSDHGGAAVSERGIQPTDVPPSNVMTKRIKNNLSLGFMNLRSGPSQQHAVIARIPAGATGVIVEGACVSALDGESSYAFCPVEWNGHKDWISSTGLE